MKVFIVSLVLCLNLVAASAQSAKLPVKEWSSSSQSPFVLYISGDGGLNDFSTGLCETVNKAGYNITAVNAKSYFWSKKTPEQTATDIATYLEDQLRQQKTGKVVMVGYSFGADVIPFIFNRMPDSLKNKIITVIMLAPSSSTDFEVHWSDILGGSKKRSMDVASEINRMGTQKTVTVFGQDDDSFPTSIIKLKNYINENLPGGHHFDGNTNEVAKTLMKYFK